MTLANFRSQAIRARVHDVRQLVASLLGHPLSLESLQTELYVRVASAQFALLLHRAAVEQGVAQIWDGENFADTEELLDRVKNLLEFEVPMLLLHPTQEPFEPREIMAEIVSLLPTNGAVMRQVRVTLGLSEAPAAEQLNEDLTTWLAAVVNATIEAQAGDR